MATNIKKERRAIILEKMTFEIKKCIHEECAEELISGNAFYDWLSKGFIVDFRQTVWTEKLQNEIKLVSYPATVWQYLKGRLLPEWLLKRFPVKMHDVKVKFKRVAKFPEFRHNSQNWEEPFVIHETIEELSKYDHELV